jgi:UDP-glucose 4-epimerase
MRILVTGSAGHLGEALIRTLRTEGSDHPVGVDLKASPFTGRVGSIADRAFVDSCLDGIDAVIHTATLHKPHVVTHTRQDFVDTNITGTLNLLEASVAASVRSFIFTSTTSIFGRALVPPPGEPAAWITEDVVPIPKNIYGVTKAAAEDLCALVHRDAGLPCLILRTSRFFPEQDDSRAIRDSYTDDNAKANEFLYRRVELEDVVSAHLLALRRAHSIGFGKYIISATPPFSRDHLADLRHNAPAVVAGLFPQFEALYAERGWTMFPGLDRIYVNENARNALGWNPRYDFAHVLDCLTRGEGPTSDLSRAVGAKPYHDRTFEGEPFPTRDALTSEEDGRLE